MKLSPMSRIVAAAFALVALSSADAFAQPEFTPILNVTATGNSVDITWTPIITPLGPAPAYEVEVRTTSGQSGAIAIPAAFLGSPPHIGLNSVPTGGYFLRVRAAAGAIKGPWSNEAFVAVGLEPCVPGIAPALAVTVDNNTGTAHASWTPVPGAVGYVVQWSRFPGVTELAENVAGTSVSRQIPMNGTFFVRVVAVTNGCGNTTSNEGPFTVQVTRRHLSPGEIVGIMNQVAAAYPRAFRLAHSHTAERYDFIILACRALFQAGGGTVGCNWRRAVVGDLSMDGITVEKPDGRFYFADMIMGAGGSNPRIAYSELGLLFNAHGQYAPWGFANPFGVPGSYPALRTHINYGPAGGW
jgi:hypothetical protein